MPYCDAYSLASNQMCECLIKPLNPTLRVAEVVDSLTLVVRMGDFLLWTNFECGLGIIVGSLPMLRKLIKSLASTNDYRNCTPDINLVTIGGKGGLESRKQRAGGRVKANSHPYEADITVMATVDGNDDDDEKYAVDGECDRDSARPGDDESTRHIIHVTRRVESRSIWLDRGMRDDVWLARDPWKSGA